MSGKAFYSVKEAAELLGAHHTTVTAAIESGKLPAIRLSDAHQGTRIPRTALFPDETQARDLKIERIRRQVADVLRKQEANDRIFAAVLDRQGELREALAAADAVTPAVSAEMVERACHAYRDAQRLFESKRPTTIGIGAKKASCPSDTMRAALEAALAVGSVTVEWLDEQIAEACANRIRAQDPEADRPIGEMQFYSGRIGGLRAVRALLTNQQPATPTNDGATGGEQ